MTKIEIYDIDAEQLEKMAEEQDTTIAQIVSDVLFAYQNTRDLMCTSPSDEEESSYA